MATLLAFPILSLAMMLQSAIVSRVTLLDGPADLVLLTLLSWVLQDRVQSIWPWALFAGLAVGWVSALPIWAPLLAYGLAAALAFTLRNRVWQIPILALFTATFFGTLLTHGIAFSVLRAFGTPLDLGQVFNVIVLPSLLLNLILAIPVNGVISEVARWVYPAELEP